MLGHATTYGHYRFKGNLTSMTMQELSIGNLAEKTGTNVQTIRYYEQVGLMPRPARSEGNQRRYTTEHMRRLAFIRNARDLGFTIETITTLLDLAAKPDRPCAEVIGIAQENLEVVRERLARLRALERALKHLIESCGGGRMAECRIIEALSDSTAARRTASETDGSATISSAERPRPTDAKSADRQPRAQYVSRSRKRASR